MRTSRRLLTPLALAVLRLLRERPMHPYEIQQLIRDHCTDLVIKVRAGSLYHTIERLARSGCIEPVETGRAGRRPERTVYAITDAGRDGYLQDLRELIRFPEQEFPVFAAAVEMLATLDPDDATRLLESRITHLEALLAAHDQVTASLRKRGLARSSTIEIEYRQALWRAEAAWVRQVIDDIQSGDLGWPHPSSPVTSPADTDPADIDPADTDLADIGAAVSPETGTTPPTNAGVSRPAAPSEQPAHQQPAHSPAPAGAVRPRRAAHDIHGPSRSTPPRRRGQRTVPTGDDKEITS